MAGDWIKMRGNLWDDPRVARLCDLTDQSEAAVVGALYWLWATADQHTENGVMPGLTLRQIDRKTGIQGIGQALCDIGWLADHPEGVRIVKFEEHNGSSAKRRAGDAQRKANIRNVSASDADKTRTDGGQNAPDCGAREEKRREEKKSSVTTDVVTAGAAGKSPDEMTKEELWSAGKAYLESQGVARSVAGSFIGGLVDKFGPDATVTVLRQAIVETPAEPKSWMTAACQRIAGTRKAPNRQEAIEARNHAGAEAWAAQGGINGAH